MCFLCFAVAAIAELPIASAGGDRPNRIALGTARWIGRQIGGAHGPTVSRDAWGRGHSQRQPRARRKRPKASGPIEEAHRIIARDGLPPELLREPNWARRSLRAPRVEVMKGDWSPEPTRREARRARRRERVREAPPLGWPRVEVTPPIQRGRTALAIGWARAKHQAGGVMLLASPLLAAYVALSSVPGHIRMKEAVAAAALSFLGRNARYSGAAALGRVPGHFFSTGTNKIALMAPPVLALAGLHYLLAHDTDPAVGQALLTYAGYLGGVSLWSIARTSKTKVYDD